MSTGLTNQQWRTVWEIYDAAAELSFDDRKKFVLSHSSSPDVETEVMALIQKLDALSPSRRADAPGVRPSLERYQLLGELARGGMGRVYSARDTELDRLVAMKFLSTDALGNVCTE